MSREQWAVFQFCTSTCVNHRWAEAGGHGEVNDLKMKATHEAGCFEPLCSVCFKLRWLSHELISASSSILWYLKCFLKYDMASTPPTVFMSRDQQGLSPLEIMCKPFRAFCINTEVLVFLPVWCVIGRWTLWLISSLLNPSRQIKAALTSNPSPSWNWHHLFSGG